MSDNAEGYLLTADSMKWFWGHYLNDASEGSQPYASPARGDTAGLPPAFVATAQYDPLRDEGIAYAEQLRKSGVTVEHVNYDDQVHDFILFGGVVPRAKESMDKVSAAIKAGLGG